MSVKDYPNERDCEHGHLRRSCPICAADADYAALLARHNALWNFYNQLESAMYEFEKEARVERMKRVAAERFAARYKEIATTAVARHNALVEAVAWERECDACPLKNKTEAEKRGFSTIWATRRAARAEVDRLLGEGKG